MWPSAFHKDVGTPKVGQFRGSIPGLHVPLSTLRCRPRERPRMTRGRSGSLLLLRVTLSFTAPRRFAPALYGTTLTSRHYFYGGHRLTEVAAVVLLLLGEVVELNGIEPSTS